MKSLAGEEDDQAIEGKPHFEHIWLVQALNKGLGSKENIIGPYRLCLTSKELTLLKVGEHDGRNGQIRFPVSLPRLVLFATFYCKCELSSFKDFVLQVIAYFCRATKPLDPTPVFV